MVFGLAANMNSLHLACYVLSPILLSLVGVAELWDFNRNIAKCACPPKFQQSMVDYAETYCSMQDNYFPFVDETIPVFDESIRRKNNPLHHHLWVAFLLMAVLCLIPMMFARFLALFDNGYESLYNSIPSTAVLESPGAASDAIMSFLRARRNFILKGLLSFKHLLLSISILLIASVQMGNVSRILGFRKFFNGFLVFSDGMQAFSDDSIVDNQFPGVTLCDFEIRILGNIQRHTVQCAQPHNLFSRKLCVMTWFWFLCLSILACCHILKSLPTNFIPIFHNSFVRSIMPVPNATAYHVSSIRSTLGLDGVLVLRRLTETGNLSMACQIVGKMCDQETSACTNASNEKGHGPPHAEDRKLSAMTEAKTQKSQ